MKLRLAIVVGAMLVTVGGVMAQGAPVRIVQAGDGTLYVLKDGVRYAITADPVGDDELAAYADGGSLGGSDVVSMLGAAPTRAGTRVGPAAPPPTNQAPPATDQAPPASDQAPRANDQTPPATDQAPPPSGTAKPPASGNPREAEIISLVSVQGAEPGGTARVTLMAAAGRTCSLAYTTPAGTRSTASGLGPQTVPDSGSLTWTFQIDGNTQRGLGRVVASCGEQSVNDTIQIGSAYGAGR